LLNQLNITEVLRAEAEEEEAVEVVANAALAAGANPRVKRGYDYENS